MWLCSPQILQSCSPAQLLWLCTQVASLQDQLDKARAQTSAAQADAEAARQSAARANTVVLEMTRLTDDNSLLANRLQQMEIDLR